MADSGAASGPGSESGSGAEFRFIDEETHHQGYVMRVASSRFADPDGGEFVRDIVYTPGAVGVVPIDIVDNVAMVTMVRQYRPPIRDYHLEIPAGLRDKPGEETEAVGYRELIEEAGLVAGRMTLLTSFLNAAGMTNQRTWLYLAEDLTRTEREGDGGAEEEWMTIEVHPLDELVERIKTNEIGDAKTVIGLLLAQRVLDDRPR